MIPKKIHYCWFGNSPLPELAIKCISSWQKYCPDYEIIEWNESNFDINCSWYTREAYEEKKWAFVSDYARLWIIYNYGGIYLDTDVEVIKPLDDLLMHKCFLGAETLGNVASGLGFGAEKNNGVIKMLLDEYNGRHYRMSSGVFDTTPCPKKNTDPLIKLGYSFSNSSVIRINDSVIYPPEYFCPVDYKTGQKTITDKTYSIHHYSASWISKEDEKIGKEIEAILNTNTKIWGQLKKQYYLYTIQRETGNAHSFILYLLNKIRLKKRF